MNRLKLIKYYFFDSISSGLIQIKDVYYNSIVRLSLFFNSEKINFYYLKQFIADNPIPISIIAQKPEQYCFALEVEYNLNANYIKYYKINNFTFSIVENESGINEIIISGINYYGQQYLNKNNLQEIIDETYTVTNKILLENGFNFKDVIRQWSYVGQILETTSHLNNKYQNYQIFNEVRANKYAKFNINSNYPAATGISMNIPGFCFEVIATNGESVIKKNLTNSKQTPPSHYDQSELIGSPIYNPNHKEPPRFERGKLIKMPYQEIIYISGTASVYQDKVYFKEDIIKQTKCILEHFDTIFKENQLPYNLNSFNNIRIYYTRQSDYDILTSFLRPVLGDIPHIFLLSEVCKNGLLVELEGNIYANTSTIS